MDKELAEYKNQATRRVELIETRLHHTKAVEHAHLLAEVRNVYRLHIDRVRDFQHERLIHLIVTFFFAGLLLLSAAGGLFCLTLAADPSGQMLNILSWSLCVLLLLTELFYVRHYYVLENGTQSLYKITKRLQVILDASK